MSRRLRHVLPSAFAMIAVAACLLSGAGSLSADPLQDLRATLGRLDGLDAVHAAVEISFRSTSTEDKVPKTTEGKLAFEVDDGPQGLRVLWPRKIVEQASQEALARARDPEQTAPTRTAMQQADAVQISEALEAGPKLLRELEGATLLAARRDSSMGRPARVLELRVEPRFSASTKKLIKKFEATTRVWVDEAGYPIAYSQRASWRGSKLFITFEGSSSEEYRFTRVGDRLVTREQNTAQKSSGFGQQSDERWTVRLVLQ